jgi:hypothetical protein
MRSVFIVTASTFAIASVAGCTSSGNAAPASPFDGVWSCTQTDSLAYTAPPDSEPETNTNQGTLVVNEEEDGSFTALSSTEAGTSCPLTYLTSGSNGTLAPGQTCLSGALTFTYGKGTIAVTGDSMNATLAFTFSGAVGKGGDIPVAGTGTTTFACTK